MEDYPSKPETAASSEDSSDDTTDTKTSKKKTPASSIQPAANLADSLTAPEKSSEASGKQKPNLAQDLLEQLRAVSPEGELPKEADESEAPLEELGAEEKRLASSEVVKARQAELAAEAAAVEPASPKAAADTASQLYLENLHNKLNKFQPRELTAEEAIDIAAQETELQLAASASEMAMPAAASLEDMPDLPAADRTHEFGLPFEKGETKDEPELLELAIDPSQSQPNTANIASAAPNTTAAASGNQAAVPSGPGQATPPGVHAGTPGAGGPTGPNIPFAPAGFGPLPGPNSHSTASSPYNTGPAVIERNPSRDAGMFFAGAIIGYFIGRRRGRIKTEKRLKPIQKKLEKEVEDLGARISAREAQIRNQAEAIARHQEVSKKQQQTAKQAEHIAHVRSIREKAEHTAKPEPALPKAVAPEAAILSESLADTIEKPVPEASAATELTSLQQKTEFGQQQAARVNFSDKMPLQKINEQLTQREILDISQTIRIDNVSLSEMYHSQKINDNSLRVLVAEYLHGGNVKQVLQRELRQNQPSWQPEAGVPQTMETVSASEPPVAAGLASNSQPPQAPAPESHIEFTDKNPESQDISSQSPAFPDDQPGQRRTKQAAAAGIAAAAASIIFWLVR